MNKARYSFLIGPRFTNTAIQSVSNKTCNSQLTRPMVYFTLTLWHIYNTVTTTTTKKEKRKKGACGTIKLVRDYIWMICKPDKIGWVMQNIFRGRTICVWKTKKLDIFFFLFYLLGVCVILWSKITWSGEIWIFSPFSAVIWNINGILVYILYLNFSVC